MQKPLLDGGQNPPGEGQFWGISVPTVKYRESPSDTSKSYLVGGISDAAFHCQFCSNLSAVGCTLCSKMQVELLNNNNNLLNGALSTTTLVIRHRISNHSLSSLRELSNIS